MNIFVEGASRINYKNLDHSHGNAKPYHYRPMLTNYFPGETTFQKNTNLRIHNFSHNSQFSLLYNLAHIGNIVEFSHFLKTNFIKFLMKSEFLKLIGAEALAHHKKNSVHLTILTSANKYAPKHIPKNSA